MVWNKDALWDWTSSFSCKWNPNFDNFMIESSHLEARTLFLQHASECWDRSTQRRSILKQTRCRCPNIYLAFTGFMRGVHFYSIRGENLAFSAEPLATDHCYTRCYFWLGRLWKPLKALYGSRNKKFQHECLHTVGKFVMSNYEPVWSKLCKNYGFSKKRSSWLVKLKGDLSSTTSKPVFCCQPLTLAFENTFWKANNIFEV